MDSIVIILLKLPLSAVIRVIAAPLLDQDRTTDFRNVLVDFTISSTPGNHRRRRGGGGAAKLSDFEVS